MKDRKLVLLQIMPITPWILIKNSWIWDISSFNLAEQYLLNTQRRFTLAKVPKLRSEVIDRVYKT